MNTEVITNKQGISIVILFIIGSAVVLSPGGEARRDIWLATLFGFAMALPMVLVYARLLALYPGKDLFDVLHEVFGKILGKTISLIFVWYTFHIGTLVIRNFTEFIQIVSFPETPQLAMIAFIGVLCIWIIKAGMEVLGRWAGFVLPGILVVLACVIVLSLTEAEFNNIQPVLYNGLTPVLRNGFIIFSFPFAETVVFTLCFCSIKSKFNIYKVLLTGLAIGGLILLITSVRNVFVLGLGTASVVYFPSLSAVSLINMGDFLQRIEIVVSVTFLLAGIVKIGVCLYAASNGLAKIFKFGSYKFIVVPVGFLMMNFSYIIYGNTMDMIEWATKIYHYYAIPFQIILPLVTFIAAEIKVRSGNRGKENCNR